ncbi:MAG: hypothetical protein LAQ69_01280 [Acidobacteriia bacterium]|nr:hypothetical protein [Terriglobia bacterium]
MDQDPLHLPPWASVGAIESKHLSDLLSLASTNYGRQTDWFLRHHDTGVKNLAAILAAESALVGLAATQKGIPAALVIALLVVLVCAASVLAWLAVRSCQRAFTAAMESVFVMAKVAWAMGVTAKVAVDESVVSVVRCPGRDDYTLYAPRWVEDSLAYTTCEGFVKANLANRKNTLFLTKLTIIVFGGSACALGLLGAGFVLLHRP